MVGTTSRESFTVKVPLAVLNIASIVHSEAANILVAFKTWCKHWSNQKILLWCDNIAVVNAFSHHKMRDPWLTTCIRNTGILLPVIILTLRSNTYKVS